MSLTNAHTHLELTDQAGHCPAASCDFFTWLESLARKLPHRTEDQIRRACEQGVEQLLRVGTTHVGDISATGLSVLPLVRSGLSGIVWIEVIALNRRQARERLPVVLRTIEQARRAAANAPLRIGLSPHATYTIHPAVWDTLLRTAEREALPLCIHTAESPAEWQLFQQGRGPLVWFEGFMALPPLPRRWLWRGARIAAAAKPVLRSLGYRYPLSRGQSPTEYLERLGVLERRPLLVHMVQVDDADIARVARSGSAVVHCPRSNMLLQCGRMPLEKFLATGVPVLLGTDSLASSPSLNVADEVEAAVALHDGKVDAMRIRALASAECLHS